MRHGDVILKLDGKPVTSAQQLKSSVASVPIGKTVELLVKRGGKTLTLRAEIGEEAEASAGRSSAADYGLEVQDLTPELAARLGIAGKVRHASELYEALRTAAHSRGLLLLVRSRDGTRYVVLRRK